ncbi:MAG: Mut7-C RNAse domain-containing protein [Elusimicrobia bacterium]|nr:Mut7-C RNAse domain-containing protein [Elusimicrobiota bacterium]
MKFIVDKMLGRLVKWLRLFGYDTVYFAGDTDSELVLESIKQQRILLTRDKGISKKKPIRIVFIESEKLFEQIEQLKSSLRLNIDETKLFTRCIKCNTPLEEIEKEKIKDKVPPFIFKTHNSFSFCVNCKKTYWQGSHIALAKERLRRSD